MLLTLVILRLALSVIFGVAAVTKFLDQSGAREAVKNFGVPARFAAAVAVLLPVTELAIAVGLLISTSTWYCALGALVLLSIFSIAIGYNLKRGRTHDCHCFGQLYSRPLGWPTLLRNVAFAFAAGFILWQGAPGANPDIWQAFNQFSSNQWLLLGALVVAAAGALVFAHRRNQRESVNPSHAVKGLPLGSAAPVFALPDYESGRTSLASLLDFGKPLMLVFVSPGCGPCVVFFKEIGRWQREYHEELTIAIISKGTIKENFVNVARNGLQTILLQEGQEVALTFGANVTPTAVVISPAGKIVSEVVAGAEEITKLLQTTLVGTGELSQPNRTFEERPLLGY